MSPPHRRSLTVDDPVGGGDLNDFAQLSATPSHAVGRLRELSVGSIHPNPKQPRKHFDGAALGALADSISERGLLQPIVVRPTSPGAFELVAGERRWRAAQIAGDLTIPALIDSNIDEAGSLELALIENVVREDLTPIEQARAIAVLLDDPNITETLLSKRLGRSRTDIAHRPPARATRPHGRVDRRRRTDEGSREGVAHRTRPRAPADPRAPRSIRGLVNPHAGGRDWTPRQGAAPASATPPRP
jgi:ParB/RepB/Spo0J family partition protein